MTDKATERERLPGETMAASDFGADERALEDYLAESEIPAHVHGGIRRYLHEHVRPGIFLQAVFANDLWRAAAVADPANARAFKAYHQLLVQIPAKAWGSWEAVNAWCDDGPQVRQ